jgi:hypothetical protein
MATHNARSATSDSAEDWRRAEEQVLARVREVGQRIIERVRQATADTETHAALADETAEHRPAR